MTQSGSTLPIILGSESIGRKKVLTEMGYAFTVMPANIDEKAIRFNEPYTLTMVLARAKATALRKRIKKSALLITADQVVLYQGCIREKPVSAQEAEVFLKSYASYPAKTVTSVVVTNTETGTQKSGFDIATIWFDRIPQDMINAYIATKDPFIQAGAFDHEHPILAPYIMRVEGERESVIGLPRKLTQRLIEEASAG